MVGETAERDGDEEAWQISDSEKPGQDNKAKQGKAKQSKARQGKMGRGDKGRKPREVYPPASRALYIRGSRIRAAWLEAVAVPARRSRPPTAMTTDIEMVVQYCNGGVSLSIVITIYS